MFFIAEIALAGLFCMLQSGGGRNIQLEFYSDCRTHKQFTVANLYMVSILIADQGLEGGIPMPPHSGEFV